MRIVELKVSQYRKLRVLAIRPAGPVVVISGENGAGKSTALNAIAAALMGRAAAGPTPIRAGEEEARIKLDMGELIVVRSFEKGPGGEITTKVLVTQPDGSKPPGTPQAILDALLGDLSFDPLAFGRWRPADQFDAIRGLVKNFDFAEHDKLQQRDFDARTEFNRRAKEHEAAANQITLEPGPKPDIIVVVDVLAEIEAARAHNADVEARAERRRTAEAEIDRCEAEIERLQMQISTLEKRATELRAKLDAAPALPAMVDIEPMKAKLSAAERVNAQVRAHEQRGLHEKQSADAKAAADRLTAAREAREIAKKSAIAATQMPIDGLDLVDGQVLLNGLPFSQGGTAERIRAGMAIGAALNPRVRVILCDEGSELDKKSMKLVEQFAEERDFQVWLTRCSHDSGLPEVEIVDGEIAADG